MSYKTRFIEINDYNKDYLELINQLSKIDKNKINKDIFTNFINNLGDNHKIIVIEDIKKSKIIGTITLLKEIKLIHNVGKVGHIEDLVIDKKYRGLGLSKILLNKIYELTKDCYKIILNCSIKYENFYKKHKFVKNGLEMSKYNI